MSSPLPQMMLFDLGRPRLEDVPIETRAAAAQSLIETTVTDLAEREALLAMVCWPRVWGVDR